MNWEGKMKIYLRAHHLICIFFIQKGDNKKFRKNLERTRKNWKNQSVEVIEGADDICKKCPHLLNNQCSLYGEQDIVNGDREARKLLDIKVGQEVDEESVLQKLPKILGVWRKEHCNQGCILKRDCERKQEALLRQ
jgi:hypothetical protein